MERAERRPESVEENQFSAAEKDLQRLFYLSYRYSQGSAGLQLDLFLDIIHHGFVDTSLLDEQVPDFILSLSPPKHHIPVGEDVAKSSHRLEWNHFREVTQQTVKKTDRSDILFKMIMSDYLFQERERLGRASMWTESDSNQDPHASFLRKYALHGANSGHPAYDELFKSLREMMIDFKLLNNAASIDDKDKMGYLFELEKLWEENHPGEIFWDSLEI